VTGEIVGFTPTSGIDGGGAQHIGGGSSHPDTLASGIRAEGQKTWDNISGSHDDGGAGSHGWL
jgi:hypothetical protein